MYRQLKIKINEHSSLKEMVLKGHSKTVIAILYARITSNLELPQTG